MKLFLALFLLAPLAHAQTSSQASATPLSDAQIIAIVHEANEADVDNGKMAKSKTKNADVKAFAEDMIKDHETANDDLKKVSKKIEVKKSKNDTSEGIEKTNKETAKKLKSLKDAEFDNAYAASEVEMHQMVLKTLDQDLIPAAHAADLKAFLTKTRGVIAEHLEHAKHLQASLKPATHS